MSWYREIKASVSGFRMEIQNLIPVIVAAVQDLYNAWEQDENGEDVEYGTGGICDYISRLIGDIIVENIDGVESYEGSPEGDFHSWSIVVKGDEAYGIDIPYCHYETGGGYAWKKTPDVVFTADMVEIFPIEDINQLELEGDWA